MVCCLLSVSSPLLNAASGTPEHLDQSIGLSWPYFPHSPHPGDVCNNRMERASPRIVGYRAWIRTVCIHDIAGCVSGGGEESLHTGGCYSGPSVISWHKVHRNILQLLLTDGLNHFSGQEGIH